MSSIGWSHYLVYVPETKGYLGPFISREEALAFVEQAREIDIGSEFQYTYVLSLVLPIDTFFPGGGEDYEKIDEAKI